jgi:cell wall-associated NlpC family hydrolase
LQEDLHQIKQISSKNLIAISRSYLGVRWVHTGNRRTGIDCAQLVAASFKEAGADINASKRYSLNDEFPLLIQNLENYCFKLENEAPLLEGDILVFRVVKPPNVIFNHVGILTEENTFVHAYSETAIKRVIETTLSPKWLSRIHSVYRYKNISYVR